MVAVRNGDQGSRIRARGIGSRLGRLDSSVTGIELESGGGVAQIVGGANAAAAAGIDYDRHGIGIGRSCSRAIEADVLGGCSGGEGDGIALDIFIERVGEIDKESARID